MDELTKAAILNAIKTEKKSYDFYYLAASQVADPESRNLLMKLADEEFEHLEGFIRLYPKGERDFTGLLDKDLEISKLCCSKLPADRSKFSSLKDALSIAIDEEKSCIELYSTFIASIRMPAVHDMFKKALVETEQHLETIEAEYAQCMGMVNDSDVDIFVRE